MDALITYLFVGLAGISALLLLITKNVMHAAYLLMLTLLSIAAIFIQLNAEFLAAAQLMVYVGGVLILLIFGIMLTNRITGEKILSKSHHLFVGVFLGVLLCTGLCFTLMQQSFGFVTIATFPDGIEHIGQQLMTDYILEFELVGVLLLLVLIGVAYIAKYPFEKET